MADLAARAALGDERGLGRSRFDHLERQVFALSVVAAPLGDAAVPWQLMQTVDRDADDCSTEQLAPAAYSTRDGAGGCRGDALDAGVLV